MASVPVVIQVVAAVLALLPSAFAQEAPPPWGWACDEGVCVKGAATDATTSLNQCKLTCTPESVVWPHPASILHSSEVSFFLPTNVTRRVSCQEAVCPLLDQAIDLFLDNLQRYHPDYAGGSAPWEGPWDASIVSHTLDLDVTIWNADDRLHLDTDESYQLFVTTIADKTNAQIVAATFFGARHALETLSQMVEYEEGVDALMVLSSATVEDAPTFPYRGILLDTSRNFFSVKSIERTLDAMAANKLNTFHWHITDSHSFPMQLETLPNMAYYGAYGSRFIYSTADIRNLVEYGRIRGIRVLPEFDAPAHVGNGWRWGEEQGLGKLAVCVNREPWQSYCVEPPCGQLNLANPNMYDVLGQIYNEMVELFSPIDLFHYGGDEVNLNCWNTTDEITSWMDENNFGRDDDAYYNQWSIFQEKSRQLLTTANGGNEVPGILWTSHLTEEGRADQYLDPTKYIIQIWTTGTDKLIGELLEKNFRVIFSNYDHWYLDCGFGAWVGEGNNWCSPYKGWQAVYDNSPLDIATDLTGSAHEDLILGGEAALWTEQADEMVLDARLWPRGAALAERLWTNPSHNWEPAETRLIHQRQRLVARGIEADRIQPQWCHQNEGLCYLKGVHQGCQAMGDTEDAGVTEA
ncbi:chitooligosaccharidolytic beta-N-acetylglucosaminidase-like [Penaeus chinensis]|uniref:chitooligosaccharidolytic beta-N-acetylglucosaminidase-like n=1 Tax=Penaeus chinensis TaxID=139456 RepID=UPI001FB84B98|nr:chitooligosaccharidolytic beta-N-acetylglucosaminidase-like [Penaeus chinensis]